VAVRRAAYHEPARHLTPTLSESRAAVPPVHAIVEHAGARGNLYCQYPSLRKKAAQLISPVVGSLSFSIGMARNNRPVSLPALLRLC
jgi:hypothetical protein